MIDIHSHILPGIDDGAKTENDSLLMAKAAVEQGIQTIVASPHHKNRRYENTKDNIIKHVSVLNELFASENIPLHVIPGQELRINGDILDDVKKGEILTVNKTKYLLIEFASDSVPQYAEQMFYDLQVEGITPVIVHPERNRELLENPRLLYDLVLKGALTQVTAASVVGKFGKIIGDFAHQLIEANLTHFIASDAHNTTTRGFFLREAYDMINDMYGLDIYYMFLENSQLMVEGHNVNRYEPSMVCKKRKKLFGLF